MISYIVIKKVFSAIKIEGKKLYEYARKGIEVKISPRRVEIKSIGLKEYNQVKNTIKFIVECSKGTYVRSLVNDIAEKLGTIATVSQLRRTSSGKFHINQALKLVKVNKDKIIPLAELNLAGS